MSSARRRPRSDLADSRRKAAIGLVGLTGATALPIVLWHRAMLVIASDFRLDVDYLVTGWFGYGLIALGLLLMVPVAFSAGRNPEGRFYPRSRNAYMGWGVSLYILGIVLASQVAEITGT